MLQMLRQIWCRLSQSCSRGTKRRHPTNTLNSTSKMLKIEQNYKEIDLSDVHSEKLHQIGTQTYSTNNLTEYSHH